MKLPNEKTAAAARDAKRRLENPLTEAQKAEKAAVEAERLRKIQRTEDINSERLRAKAERRSAARAEGLAAEATRKSTRRKSHRQLRRKPRRLGSKQRDVVLPVPNC
jgi:hypothetical protein